MAALLVSVRDAAEVAPALEGGAALIDVKEPANGALGRAAEGVCSAVVAAAAGRVPVSAALGELLDGAGGVAGVSYAKYGLAGCLRREDWAARLLAARERVEAGGGCRLVFVAYADWERAQAPPPAVVFRFAVRQRAAAVLLDTWGKDGSTLPDWARAAEVVRLCAQAREGGVRVALAGSLGVDQILTLRGARPDWFAVRGAACAGGERGAGIDATRVRRLVEASA
jgi:uncharacterized protein (UPF0264 family)